LLADDHPIVAVGLKEVLEQEFTTSKFYTARTGQEALAVLEQHPIDILFLDVSMPALDAYGAFPAIKKQYPATKVILYTQFMAKDMIRKSSKEIAALLHLGENTINSYRQSLLKKTGTKNTDELIRYAFNSGLI